MRGNSALVDECVAFYEEHFPDRYFLELIRTGRPDEESYLHAAVELAEARGLPVVATNDVRFIDSSDFDAHEIRVAIHDGFTLDDPKRPRNYSPQQYMRSEEEMCELFADIPEALANTVEIAKRCNVTVRLGEYFLPQFPTGDMSTEDYLVKRAKEGLEERLAFLFPDEEERLKRRPEYDERLETELQVINQMGFPGYFLIVMEFIQWSKDNGVPVGPGRGSGAGSLVAYALKSPTSIRWNLTCCSNVSLTRNVSPCLTSTLTSVWRNAIRLSNTWRTCTVVMRYRRSSPSVQWRRKR